MNAAVLTNYYDSFSMCVILPVSLINVEICLFVLFFFWKFDEDSCNNDTGMIIVTIIIIKAEIILRTMQTFMTNIILARLTSYYFR